MKVTGVAVSTAGSAVPPPSNFDDVLAEAAKFVEECEKTRTGREVHVPSRTGRTGREEWT